MTVRDYPAAPVRGIAEGFFGKSWSQQERLEQLDFLGRTKQNRYLYAPGDDPFRQAARWRDPYPAAQRAEFRELADRARRNHVTLGWAVSPGQGLCFSSADDRKALLRKLDAMRALGFGAFQLRFEDVSYSEWHCDEDGQKYGSGPKAAARAHAELANEVARHLSRRHPDAEPLSVMPTEFYQDGATDYRTALAEKLERGVQVAWTGVGVVPRTITGGELAEARSAFDQHPLVTMDNYPVNDYAQDRIFLGPYRGREPAVATGSAAVLANAMKQPTASRIPLFTAADYAWNPKGYRPDESWQAAIEAVADGAYGGTDAPPVRTARATPANVPAKPAGRHVRPYARWRATTPPRCSATRSRRICARCWPTSGTRTTPWAPARNPRRSGCGRRPTDCATPSARCAPRGSGCPRTSPVKCARGWTSWPGAARRVSGPYRC